MQMLGRVAIGPDAMKREAGQKNTATDIERRGSRIEDRGFTTHNSTCPTRISKSHTREEA